MKQFALPAIIEDDKSELLEKIKLGEQVYDEKWIQKICFEHSQMLPVSEIEPTFSGMIPICRELPLKSGFVDIIYINEYGYITIAECKLWRNPEARRKVVGQILDYAKDIARMDYSAFEKLCLITRKQNDISLFELVSQYYPEIEEKEFIDNIQRNLEKGRFLLAIIGDGIRENTEELLEFMTRSGQLNFTLSLIELPVYRIPNSNKLIITPRIIAKTKELERIVYNVINRSDIEEIPEPIKSESLSEQIFFERLEKHIDLKNTVRLKEFIDRIHQQLNMDVKLGRGKRLSLNIKSPNDTVNFASIQETGEVWFYGIVPKTEEIGDKTIGVEYLEKLAKIVVADFDQSFKEWNWCVRRNGKYLLINEYLGKENDWVDLISKTLFRINEKEEE